MTGYGETFLRIVLTALAVLLSGAPALAQSSPLPTPSPLPITSPNPAAAPESTTIVLVPKGTPLVVRSTVGLNSYSAHTGEKLHYDLVNDIIVNGFVVARSGDDVEGAVQEAQQGEAPGYFKAGHGANLRVSVDEVHSFCGDTLHVVFDRSEYRRRQGAFGENKDVQVMKGQQYIPLTSRAQKVCGVLTTATPAPMPTDAIRTADH
jgi:hypothetical protein